MNDRSSDSENAALTHGEATQVLRLSPEGLRRLADLDEAITELRAARRSLLANRLESIRDAFAAARKDRSEQDDSEPTAEQPNMAEAAAESEGAAPSEPVGRAPVGRTASPRIGINGDGVHQEAAAQPSAGDNSSALAKELRMLRTEVTELRREVAALKEPGRGAAELQQIHRRLSYLEAEMESRQI